MIIEASNMTRNTPCWCGSGKKYKRCHLLLDQKNDFPTNVKKNALQRGVILKTDEQIEGIKKSCKLTKHLLDMVEERISQGVTTNKINEWVHRETISNGAIPAPLNYGLGQGKHRIPFPKSVCTSINDVICHGIPNERKLYNGDIINVDITSNLGGYFGDASRMFIIGEVTDETRKLVEVAKECLNIGIKKVRPNCKLGDIGHAIQVHAEKSGFSVVRDFAGHGVGVEFHEPPQVLHYGSPGEGESLFENMTLTIEPMVNMGRHECKILEDGWTAVTLDGSLSAQWEHTLLVTKNGVEILT